MSLSRFCRKIVFPLAALGAVGPGRVIRRRRRPAQPVNLNVNLGNGSQPADMATAIQILLFMTVLTLAPAIVMLMTSFTRIVIVLGFVRTALGVQNAPSNQIVIGLSLFPDALYHGADCQSHQYGGVSAVLGQADRL